jgi:predicted dehydrogenase
MLRGAMVGFGNVAVHGHVPGWVARSDVQIVAVSDTSPARRLEAAAQLPRARWYDSADELLERESLDFVDIAAPPSSHAELIRAALRRGVHVLCEKPLVCSLTDLAGVTQLASTAGRVLHTVHNWHHAPIVQRVRALLEEGAIGRVERVVWHTLRTNPAAAENARAGNWRVDPDIAGGGVLTDHGWHVFYLLRRWIGVDPIAVSAVLETRRHTQWPVEDTATVQLVFPEARAEILLTWASDRRGNWAELTGTEGTIRLEDDAVVVARHAGGQRERRWPCRPALSSGSHHADWFGPVRDEFLGTMTGALEPGANLAEASLCVALESLARESSRRSGRALPVTVPAAANHPPAASGSPI